MLYWRYEKNKRADSRFSGNGTKARACLPLVSTGNGASQDCPQAGCHQAGRLPMENHLGERGLGGAAVPRPCWTKTHAFSRTIDGTGDRATTGTPSTWLCHGIMDEPTNPGNHFKAFWRTLSPQSHLAGHARPGLELPKTDAPGSRAKGRRRASLDQESLEQDTNTPNSIGPASL